MGFQPAFCPCEGPAAAGSGFQYIRRGTFTRSCDGRSVQRFQCKRCLRTFSTQTFRVDRKLQKPWLDGLIVLGLVSKVSQRQLTRKYHCGRGAIARRLKRYGKHCRDFQLRALAMRPETLAWEGHFQLDELETFETDRRLCPVTVPVLVHMPSRCILHATVGTLPPRKPLPPSKQRQLLALEARTTPRRSQSREKVLECFTRLDELCHGTGPVHVRTDEKSTYRAILRKAFGARLVHQCTHSTEPRTYLNPLFPINHTFAMLRDGLGRLVRRNWGATKEREKLDWHMWLYMGWRNFVRPITNRRPRVTAAMAAGIALRPLQLSELLHDRIFHPAQAQKVGPESERSVAPGVRCCTGGCAQP